jgi:hypothetical protein
MIRIELEWCQVQAGTVDDILLSPSTASRHAGPCPCGIIANVRAHFGADGNFPTRNAVRERHVHHGRLSDPRTRRARTSKIKCSCRTLSLETVIPFYEAHSSARRTSSTCHRSSGLGKDARRRSGGRSGEKLDAALSQRMASVQHFDINSASGLTL